ncbi:SIS domain-containing protein [Sulfurimonas sp.]|uniref:SIS domain-containing protein n=1 Tax=Sulfurimonas sp. TaxID=2022749 RepID=UPI0035680626
MVEFAKSYVQELVQLLQKIDYTVLEKIISKLESTNGRIYIIGNGGSAATASHMVNDLGIGLKRREIKNFDVYSLSDNTPVCSAIANDIGYENVFYMQLKDRIKQDDLLMAISCSGNSENIVKAVEYAKDVGTDVIGITGFDGGRVKELCDISFHVESKKGDYGLVEDVHMILDHIIYSYYIDKDKK